MSTILIGCMPQPKLTRRYNSDLVNIPNHPQAVNRGANLTVFSMDKPSSSSDTKLTNLSDHGQAALIEALKQTTDNNTKKLLAALGTPIKPPRNNTGDIVTNVFERRLIFSIENLTLRPADRIQWVKVVLELPKGDANFKKWDKFASSYEKVDLGKLTFTQGNEFGLEVGIPLPAGIQAGGSAKIKRDLEEELSLKQRYVAFTGTLTPKRASFIQQGVVGIDLTGNSAVDLTLEVKGCKSHKCRKMFSFSNLINEKRKYNDQDDVVLRTRRAIFPLDASQDIKAKVTFFYLIRKVTGNHRSVAEGDDSVEHVLSSYTLADHVLLVPERSLEFFSWQIQGSHGFLKIDNGSQDGPEDMYFASYDEANNFFLWLKDKKSSIISNRDLYMGDDKLTGVELSRLKIVVEQLN
ncbi:MAG: hypothetical protein IH964_12195 [Candidatus Dadabacteria bacterium]|nr:hypothetical protein [Candidatus Dadabacteria bacterium]